VETADWRSFMAEWGVDVDYTRGGPEKTGNPEAYREIHLLQRKATKPGAGLGKTTGWIHRSVLKKNGVRFWNGVLSTWGSAGKA
jgi:2,4-dienoyl-CoA reductase (NADPH2)